MKLRPNALWRGDNELQDAVDDLEAWVLAFELHVETILAIRRCHRIAAGLPPTGPPRFPLRTVTGAFVSLRFGPP